MKKFFIYFIISIIFFNLQISPANCASKTQNAEISKIENNLYGFDYINDELKNRVARLEKTIYGKESSGDLSNRLKRIAKDINADEIGLEIPPVEDTFAEKEETVADSTVDYPVVNEIEMKLFNQTYKNKDFHSRIVAIERKVFGKIYDVDDYSTRMDRIKTAVLPESLTTDSMRFDYNNHPLRSSDLSGISSSRYSGIKPYGQRNYTRPYSNYGEFNSDNPISQSGLNEELAELEYDMFGTEFSSDDTKTRIKRLNSVNRAKKSSKKYDSQKFQQRMSTAMEIGAMILMILAMVL